MKQTDLVEIKIGRKYVRSHRTTTGAQIRELGGVHETHDLFQIVYAEGDVLIGDTDLVRCVEGTKFFFAPKYINVGA